MREVGWPTNGRRDHRLSEASAGAPEVAVRHVPDQVHADTRDDRCEETVVAEHDHLRQVQHLIDHIRNQGFYVIDRDPTDEERQRHPLIARVTQRAGGYNAERTRMDLPISLAVTSAVQSTSEQAIVRLPTSGGSLPLSTITDNLTTVTMTVPIVNYDNNQHAENENLRLQNLWDGIETMAAIMTLK